MGNVPSFESISYNPENSGKFFRYAISPGSFDLDPYWFHANGNDFSIAAKDTKQTVVDLNLRKDPAKTEIRTVGIRGPIMLSGWGYDIAGLPVPNGVNQEVFDPDTGLDRAKWKSGPVDLRWDDDRKVWVGGPEIIEGVMDQDLDAPSNIESPVKASGTIYRGKDLQITGDSVTLYNRNPGLTLKNGDYFMAAKVNYEWRPVGGGGGGGSGTPSGNIIMLLGTYDQYSGCPGVPARPPTGVGGTPCWPTYAWAAYGICGYKYVKTGDMRGYGKWAWELNGGTASAMRRFYSAYYGGNGNCKGVRFLGFSSQSSLSCTCPEKIAPVKCFKVTFKTVPAPPEGTNTGCPITKAAFDEKNAWNKTYTVTMCGSNCSYSGTTSDNLFTVSLLFNNEPVQGNDCYWGPDEFDPCDPCSDFGSWSLTVDTGIGSGETCGGAGNLTGYYSLTQLSNIVDNCTSESPQRLKLCKSCQPTTDPPTYFYFLTEQLTLTCCSQAEKDACAGGGGGGGGGGER
jgi:hypothetical protein